MYSNVILLCCPTDGNALRTSIDENVPEAELMEDETLQAQAKVYKSDIFKFAFQDEFIDKIFHFINFPTLQTLITFHYLCPHDNTSTN